ncbi:MAG TPA: sigma 54-interacting transcriptional regulator [Candidatus Copromorpha excrementigallinarum]|uniref:Sigma 54-interacting transcriptional regulator n=1 Tax=Candidatus Allocopromorpha excrementigallinarum TaxID=2840742 RepID=A0A9D1L6D8_9FIRM|nr:sigma 54-interacting transcriptional regulator [Candidatus Copromorpha excrementigallinarum]
MVTESSPYASATETPLYGFAAADLKSCKIIYADPAFSQIVNQGKGGELTSLDDFLDRDSLEQIHKCESRLEIKRDRYYCLQIQKAEEEGLILLGIYDMSKITRLEEENRNLFLLNKQLREVFEIYNYDTICIADSNGTVEFAGEACARHCGISQEDIIGMNMYDLEREKHFYPAVTVRVLESQKEEIIMQDTKIGVKLCTIGVPVFDEENRLSKVISISRDFSREIDIAKSMIKLSSQEYQSDGKEEVSVLTCDEKIYNLMEMMKRAAKTNATIMLYGETGTGKSLFANYIHNLSNRAGNAFISVNCGAIPESLIESELFGYEKGAFTGASSDGKTGLLERAQNGTVFFDEIGDLPLPQQVKLLHVLQDRAITRVGGNESIKLNIRVIAATNKDLERMVKEGEFREDLFYRLNVVSFEVPRLRDRKEDIFMLITHFMNKYNQENGSYKEISDNAIKYLSNYTWPGNIRELENTIEMLCVVTPENVIDVKHLPPKFFDKTNYIDEKKQSVEVKGISTLKKATAEMEKQLIELAIKKHDGNQQKIADELGVDRSTITRKINAYNLKELNKK